MIPHRHRIASTLAVCEVDPLELELPELDVVDPQLRALARVRPRASPRPRRCRSACRPGWISSAARKPVSPGPAASSSTRWPGCSARCVDHPRRDRHAQLADAVGAPAPTGRRALPPLAASRPARSSGIARRLTGATLRLAAARRSRRTRPRSGRSSAAGRSPAAPRRPAGAAARSASSISGQRSGGMSACWNGFHTSPRNSFTNERGDGVAVALDLARTPPARSSSDDPAVDDLLGHRQQRRARDLVAVARRAGRARRAARPRRAPRAPRSALDPEAPRPARAA